MNKQPSEPTGEHFSASPELGFAFGRIPIKKVADFLHTPELRGDTEAENIQLHLEIVSRYFKDGPELYLWDSYVSAEKQAREVTSDQWLSTEIHDKYREIAEMIKTEHLQSVDEETEYINTFLAQYSGVISKDTNGLILLQSVESIPIELTPAEMSRKASPVRQIAAWSDETRLEIDKKEQLYVNMVALPEKYSIELNRYRTAYGVDLSP